ncbi:nuclear transport factor 2 family protein [Actinoplanes siamensis]|uniref:SnoaL-like domain-containing protein n=1 Tax=Actinoplanes siamensis TaxID=1223317 RepID=A0A919NDU0_9ACTN|nr:nuclear transport factor 2 family protein [Actinoplanes siamensis]GIF09358.1 hypothetical protein Asi03nite_68960 [Actinoplanes siamensis]
MAFDTAMSRSARHLLHRWYGVAEWPDGAADRVIDQAEHPAAAEGTGHQTAAEEEEIVSPDTNMERSADDLVRLLYAIVDEERWTELGEVFAEDCVIDRAEQQLVGLDRIRDYYLHERRFGQTSHRPERIVGDRDAIACWGSFSAVGRAGELIEERFADTFLVRDLKVVRRATYLFPKPR